MPAGPTGGTPVPRCCQCSSDRFVSSRERPPRLPAHTFTQRLADAAQEPVDRLHRALTFGGDLLHAAILIIAPDHDLAMGLGQLAQAILQRLGPCIELVGPLLDLP